MHVTVKKWGNSASVRIPVAIMEAVNLSWMKLWMCTKKAGVSS